MRQYPIWKIIDNDSYATDKSHGVNDRETEDIKVGTSSSNSHDFIKTEILTYKEGGSSDLRTYFLYFVDGILIKKSILTSDGTLIPLFNKLTSTKED